MTRVLLDEVVETDYGLFELNWADDDPGFEGDFDRVFAGQVNGLVGAASSGGLYINLARRSGGSPVRIALLTAPPPLDTDTWEDVVEVSVTVPPGAAPGWYTWCGENSGPLDLPPGTYRVRISAWGRDAGRGPGEAAEGTVDRYLLEFWPAPHRPDAIVRSTSDDAAYWHREVGGRR
jgi:hypothetical protein